MEIFFIYMINMKLQILIFLPCLVKWAISQTTAKKPLTTCSGAVDLVFVIDASDTMTAARFNTVKAQLQTAITQSNITWGDNNTHVGVVISHGFNPGWPTVPYRLIDLSGCTYFAYGCSPTVNSATSLQSTIQSFNFLGGKNNLFLSMNETLSGEYNGLPDAWFIFGGPYWGAAGDRPDVADVMIVISGTDTSNVAPATSALLDRGVKIFSIGFQDLPTSQLNAISGNPNLSYTTTPDQLASVITKICSNLNV